MGHINNFLTEEDDKRFSLNVCRTLSKIKDSLPHQDESGNSSAITTYNAERSLPENLSNGFKINHRITRKI